MTAALTDAVAIVTGGGGGIGRACVGRLAGAGARVVVVDRDERAAAAAASEAGGEALVQALDVTREDDMARMAEETLARFGRIDVLVAAAGLLRVGGGVKTVADTPLAEWEAVLAVNLTGTFLSNRAVLPAMLAVRKGDIVNVSSTSGQRGRPFDGPYCASKFGVIGFSESLAEEVSRQGVRVQTVLPDAVDTPLWEQNGSAALKPTEMLDPGDVADFVVYLLSLPRDAFLLNPVLLPFTGRKRRKNRPRS